MLFIGSGNSVNSALRLQVVDKFDDGGLPGFPETANVIVNVSASAPTGFLPKNWFLPAQIDPSALFTDLASVVDLQIQNTLQAFTGETGGLAQIQKKLVLTTAISTVPLPAGLGFLAFAVAGLFTRPLLQRFGRQSPG